GFLPRRAPRRWRTSFGIDRFSRPGSCGDNARRETDRPPRSYHALAAGSPAHPELTASSGRRAVLDRDRLVDQADQLFAIAVAARGASREVADVLERPVLGVLAAAQDVREGRDREREPEVRGGRGERGGGPADHRKRGLGRLLAARLLVADAQGRERR